MTMWCENCKRAVDTEVKKMTDEHGYEFGLAYCLDCGTETYREAGKCVVCGHDIAPGESLCEKCRDEIEYAVFTIMAATKASRKAVLDGIAEYIGEE